MAWSLNGNWDDELLRAEIASRLGEGAMRDLFPDLPREAAALVAGKLGGGPSALDLLRDAPPRPRGQGSNSWVVAGSRTVSGKPLLANDPHLAILMPSIWIEIHLAAPGYEAAGVALPFAPGVVIGRTPRHAWGFTNVGGDTQDLYLERLNEDGTAALYEGAWEPVTTHREEILVRGRDEPEALEVRETRHGPILDSYVVGIASPQVVEGGVRGTYALRWVGAEHAIEPATLVRIARAASFAEFRDAVRGWEAPGQNMLYADEDGHIGYQCTGLYPIRRSGNGTTPVPGWTSGFEWDGFIPFEELPWAEDPPEGFLATANNRIHDDGYPRLIGHDFSPPSRIRRIGELLAAAGTHTPETFAAMQTDTVSIPARGLARVFEHVTPADDRQRAAIALLQGWDGNLAVDSAAACVYEAWCHHVAELVLRPRLGDELFTHYYGRRESSSPWRAQVLPNLLAHPTEAWFGAPGTDARDETLRRALDAALDELEERLGPDPASWRWGGLHRATFAGPLAMIPDLAELFTGGSVEIGGDDDTVSQGGFEPEGRYGAVIISSWRQIQDVSRPDASVGVHTTGQSGNPASAHWSDLVRLWAEGRYHSLPLSPEAVRAHAESAMTLVPR
jgi:penicillin amidase